MEMKKEFTTDELIRILKAVEKEKKEVDKLDNEFTIKAYEELLHKLECNINHNILNEK